jgi:hypothetical protein
MYTLKKREELKRVKDKIFLWAHRFELAKESDDKKLIISWIFDLINEQVITEENYLFLTRNFFLNTYIPLNLSSCSISEMKRVVSLAISFASECT